MRAARLIPSIDELRQRETVRDLEARYGRDATLDAIRQEAAALRVKLAGGPVDKTTPIADTDDACAHIERAAAVRLSQAFNLSLRRVINATGVIIHTNLGRAPLAAAAAARVAKIATGYSNLEYDLVQGSRGVRDEHADALLCRLTGAEAAVVVNNNAAAVLLLLSALAAGREVVISRGELVEIGGGFRVPDLMTQSGAILREVGTTNKTRAADYGAAVSDRTALILRVHPSNFQIVGFTERPRLEEIVAVGRQLRVPVVEDLGSGLVGSATTGARSAAENTVTDEPTVRASLAAGASLVTFSGDKLLGGPQAGIIVGRRVLVEKIRRHPLMRAVRVDKMTYAALEATLVEYAAGRAEATIPVARMIATPCDAIETRARALSVHLAGRSTITTAIVDGLSAIGGGSAPGVTIPTRLLAIALEGMSADGLDKRLRALDPPVVARIENDRVVLDLRTVLPEQDEVLAEALAQL